MANLAFLTSLGSPHLKKGQGGSGCFCGDRSIAT